MLFHGDLRELLSTLSELSEKLRKGLATREDLMQMQELLAVIIEVLQRGEDASNGS